MKSRAVVKANDVVRHIGHGFLVFGEVLLPDPLRLQVQKEALHDGDIPAVAFTSHAADQSEFLQQTLMQRAGVLRAAPLGCGGIA